MSAPSVSGPHRSLWLQQALNGPGSPPLSGAQRADVAIIGGGFVGLWTALSIKELSPHTDVAIIERDVCGGGASGRNGGFAMTLWQKLPSLVATFGVADALAIAADAENAVNEIESFAAAHGIDADVTRSGWLWTATTAAQLGAWDSCMRLCDELGVGPFSRLDAAEVAGRAGSARHLAGVFDRSVARVQPAALARGLRRVALERGVRIYENSRVTTLPGRSSTMIRTADGSMDADRVVVAMGAWAADLWGLRTALVVVSSDVIATAPVPDRLAEIGWVGGECVTDSQQMVDYYRTTHDGRVIFGKGGWGLAYGARIGASFDRDSARAVATEADFRRVYPALSDVPVEQSWSGPVDRSYDGLPILGRLGRSERVFCGVGWSGNGVGPSWIGGKVLASLALCRDDRWSTHPLANRRHGVFPPEPIRFVGAHLVRGAVRRKEVAEAQGKRPGWLATRIAGLVPAGLEDK